MQFVEKDFNNQRKRTEIPFARQVMAWHGGVDLWGLRQVANVGLVGLGLRTGSSLLVWTGSGGNPDLLKTTDAPSPSARSICVHQSLQKC